MDNLIYTDFLLKFERAINKDVFIENKKVTWYCTMVQGEVSKKRLVLRQREKSCTRCGQK
jgi:hypothetical protein